MNYGFIAICVLLGVALLNAAHTHGKPKTGTESFWSTLASVFIELTLIIWALHWRIN